MHYFLTNFPYILPVSQFGKFFSRYESVCEHFPLKTLKPKKITDNLKITLNVKEFSLCRSGIGFLLLQLLAFLHSYELAFLHRGGLFVPRHLSNLFTTLCLPNGTSTIEFGGVFGVLQMSLDLPADMCIKGGCLPWCLWLPLGPPSCCMWECAGFPSWLPRPSKLAPLPPSPIPPPNHLGLNKQSPVCGNLNRI